MFVMLFLVRIGLLVLFIHFINPIQVTQQHIQVQPLKTSMFLMKQSIVYISVYGTIMVPTQLLSLLRLVVVVTLREFKENLLKQLMDIFGSICTLLVHLMLLHLLPTILFLLKKTTQTLLILQQMVVSIRFI